MKVATTELKRISIGDKIKITPRGKRRIWTAEFFHGGHHRHRSLKTSNFKIVRQRAMALEVGLVGGDYAVPKKSMSVSAAVDDFMAAKNAEGRALKTLVKYHMNWIISICFSPQKIFEIFKI